MPQIITDSFGAEHEIIPLLNDAVQDKEVVNVNNLQTTKENNDLTIWWEVGIAVTLFVFLLIICFLVLPKYIGKMKLLK